MHEARGGYCSRSLRAGVIALLLIASIAAAKFWPRCSLFDVFFMVVDIFLRNRNAALPVPLSTTLKRCGQPITGGPRGDNAACMRYVQKMHLVSVQSLHLFNL